MTILDIILIIPLGWLVFLGWKKGVIREAATLAGIVAGIWAAVNFSKLVAKLLDLNGESAILIAFFITFVGPVCHCCSSQRHSADRQKGRTNHLDDAREKRSLQTGLQYWQPIYLFA